MWVEDEATEVLTPLKAANIKHLIKDLPVHTNKCGLVFICLHLLSPTAGDTSRLIGFEVEN